MSDTVTRQHSLADVVYERVQADPIDINAEGLFAIAYVESGGGVLICGNKRYEVGEGSILIFPVGAKRRFESGGSETEAEVICFKPHLLPEAVRSQLKAKAPIIDAREIADGARRAFKMIERETKENGEFRDEAIRAYITLLGITLARVVAPAPKEMKTSPVVASALTYIDQHLGERLSLADAARVAKVSVGYLSRRFKEEVGVGFADYIASARLDRAEAMLKDKPEMSITEVAFSCGFNDSNYFSDQFKKRFGLSPLKYKHR